jgi:hypothetical protein
MRLRTFENIVWQTFRLFHILSIPKRFVEHVVIAIVRHELPNFVKNQRPRQHGENHQRVKREVDNEVGN